MVLWGRRWSSWREWSDFKEDAWSDCGENGQTGGEGCSADSGAREDGLIAEKMLARCTQRWTPLYTNN
eukprot:4596567-Pleurochrysis_carterae.AAC.1